ncbi:MAG TPA: hypothetical protein PKB00_01425 [Microthrixaceae bacterium]|nr:hypothetical protein [Microthrixaceae bacterium]HNH38285.1 hypothetical protein [Microthrixaceae bacterium]HNH94799.1 hypothetical protein [Microthrixaceae bacterium]
MRPSDLDDMTRAEISAFIEALNQIVEQQQRTESDSGPQHRIARTRR